MLICGLRTFDRDMIAQALGYMDAGARLLLAVRDAMASRHPLPGASAAAKKAYSSGFWTAENDALRIWMDNIKADVSTGGGRK